jgi:hypothetical protein
MRYAASPYIVDFKVGKTFGERKETIWPMRVSESAILAQS